MATTATVSVALAYSDANGSEELAPDAVEITLTNAGFTRIRQSIATSETTINLAGLSGPGLAVFVNRDATNYVELKVAASGAIFAKLGAAGKAPALLQLGSGAQVPVAIANAGACIIDIFILRT